MLSVNNHKAEPKDGAGEFPFETEVVRETMKRDTGRYGLEIRLSGACDEIDRLKAELAAAEERVTAFQDAIGRGFETAKPLQGAKNGEEENPH